VRALVVAGIVVAALWCGARAATAAPTVDRASQIDALGAEDRRDVERAVAAITDHAAQADAELLFAAARACEDKLDDPGRAAAIYARIVRELPDARVAPPARRRLAELRPLIGAHGETAALAAELAQLTAHADQRPAAAVLARGGLLAEATWPGAPAAALWLADWLRRAGRLAEAQARYAIVIVRWPTTPEAHEALRGAAAAAIDALDWPLARRLADRLPDVDPADRSVRDDLRASAARGRRRAQLYAAAWLVLAVAFLALLASLAEATWRSPRDVRAQALRPPIEILFLAPVAAVLIGVAFTAHRLIAPAVATIALGGLVFAYLSGATLDHLRRQHRRARLRGLLHLALCLVSVVALAYIALTRDHLVDLLLETVRFGPES